LCEVRPVADNGLRDSSRRCAWVLKLRGDAEDFSFANREGEAGVLDWQVFDEGLIQANFLRGPRLDGKGEGILDGFAGCSVTETRTPSPAGSGVTAAPPGTDSASWSM
jgi:hypothetical protein